MGLLVVQILCDPVFWFGLSELREKWQPVGESNPSFQVENLAS
jgi:hypothetical protein